MIDKAKAKDFGIDTGRLEYMDRFLAKAAQDKWNSAIAICVARRGVEVFSGAYGPASPGGPPLQLDMITDVQSVTKPVLATLVMMLQEDGLLDVVDPLQKYYPELQGQDMEGIALHHLLTHTSGMQDESARTHTMAFLKRILPGDFPESDTSWEALVPVLEKARRMLGYSEDGDIHVFADRLRASAPLQSKPGTQFSYCNLGYRLLAGIVEGIAGETMDKLAEQKIFKPLGMLDSHFVLPEEKWPRVLLREESCRGGDWMNSVENRSSFAGSSGLKTTVGDMLRFGLLFGNMGTLDGVRILSPASVRGMTKNYNAKVPDSYWRGRWYGSSWGLGWNVRAGKLDDMGILRSDEAYDHAGYGGARLLVDPAHELVVALYMVDEGDDDYILHAKTVNIIYSALD